MKVTVRDGYTFFHGSRVYRNGDVIDVSEDELKGQSWKVIRPELDEKTIKNRLFKKAKKR